MSYAWIITRDHIPTAGAKPGTNGNAIGMVGPRGASDEFTAILAADMKGDARRLGADLVSRRFRMKDDDGEVYYTGLFLGDADSADAFGPLEDFGTPNAGCTSIEYLQPNGAWEQL